MTGLPSHLTVTFRGQSPPHLLEPVLNLTSESALGLTDLHWQGPTLQATLTGNPNPLLRALAAADVTHFRLERASLEEAFLNDHRTKRPT